MIFDRNTGEAIGYNSEERNEALNVSLTLLAASMGYTPVRQGRHYSLKEMDSLVIYNDRSWNRWSGKGNITGGTQIDFMMEFGNAKTPAQAIRQLMDFKGQHIVNTAIDRDISMETQQHAQHEMILPPKNDNYRRLFAYLIKTRGISQKTVSDFVHRKLIYEDAVHHNVVFLGYDPDGKVRYAGLRGTADLPGKTFKMDVPGNDKNYGLNIVNKQSGILLVFESTIDCMSYIDLFDDHYTNKLVLGMVEDNPLEQFLNDYNHIYNIKFCLDNDEAGHIALNGRIDEQGNITKEGLVKKYSDRGFAVDVLIPPAGKDWNETLLATRSYNRGGRGR